jgi:hypothetical protein
VGAETGAETVGREGEANKMGQKHRFLVKCFKSLAMKTLESSIT